MPQPLSVLQCVCVHLMKEPIAFSSQMLAPSQCPVPPLKLYEQLGSLHLLVYDNVEG